MMVSKALRVPTSARQRTTITVPKVINTETVSPVYKIENNRDYYASVPTVKLLSNHA